MQGRLSDRRLKATLRTKCAWSERPIEMTVDSDFGIKMLTPDCAPVVSVPLIDFKTLGVDTIYDAL